MHTLPSIPTARRAGPQALRFSLAALLGLVAAMSVLFATMVVVGSAASLFLLLFASLAAAHVVGNAIGTKLRDEATREVQEQTQAGGPTPLGADSPRAPQLNSGHQLVQHSAVTRRQIGLAALGSVMGATVGGAGLATANWEHITAAGIGLGAISSAVLAGLFVFLTAGFVSTFRQALREALARPDVVAGDR